MGDVTKLQEELFAARQAYAVAQRSVSELTGQLQDSKEENSALQSQLRQHQQLQTESRQNAQKVDELEGFLAGKDAENKRLKGRNQLLQEEVTELRSQCDSKNLEASQAQGSAALHKSRLDEQAAQILLLKRQLLEMEDEVCTQLLATVQSVCLIVPISCVCNVQHITIYMCSNGDAALCWGHAYRHSRI